MTNQPSKYPLLPYSQLVYDMTRWMPGMYRFSFVLRWKDGAKEIERIENAFREAIANHPVFSSHVDCRGKQYRVVLKNILRGPYHDVAFSAQGKDVIIRASGSRILGDGKSMEILIEDIAHAYRGEKPERDDYWGYVEHYEQCKQEPHYLNSKAWLEHEFADESVPVRPSIDRRRLTTLLPPKAGLFPDDYTDLAEALATLKETHHISFEGIFSLCAALAIAEYNGTEEAALTWAYEGRETPNEQRVFGSLHRDVPFQISRKSKVESQKPASREELIREARNQIRSGIAHSDYPYTLTAPYNQRWNYAVNVLRITELEKSMEKMLLPVEVAEVPEQKYAYALLDVEIHEKGPSLSLVYRYSATHYKPESIRKFADLVRKFAEWLVEEV